MVGNKCDLPDDQREVKAEEGEKFAKEWGCKFMEVSAKEKVNFLRIDVDFLALMSLYVITHA